MFCNHVKYLLEIFFCFLFLTCVLGISRVIDQLNDIFILNVARGFGMRVVGGKPDASGRREAVIVWTVPGGPADLAGLQQGDKVTSLLF